MDATRDGNKDAARSFRDLGLQSFKTGDLEGAYRRLSKSQRLFPCIETEALLARVKDEMGAKTAGSSGGATSAGEARGSSGGQPAAKPTANGSSVEDLMDDLIKQRYGKSESAPRPAPPRPYTGEDGPSEPQLRRRPTTGTPASDSRPSSSGSESSSATHEQIMLVRQVLRSANNYYEVLEVSRTCTEDDVKKSYRRLSLKVHPDKNKAPGAEEAFKVVSRAFKCLSDSRLRANYDSFGHEDPAQSRLQQQRSQYRRHASAYQQHPFAGHPFFDDEFDPNDIFNAFFGVNGMNARVYTNNSFRQRRPNRQASGNRGGSDGGGGGNGFVNVFALFQFIPFLLFLIYLLTPASDPLYKTQPTPPYTINVQTARLKVPYYVKSVSDFEKAYPAGSAARWRVEAGVEGEYKERLETYCYHERVQRAQLFRWGNADKAKEMSMPNCEELRRLQAVH